MNEYRLTLPELALIGGTRGMIGFGVGLLIAGRLGAEQRRAVGWTSLVAGALTTIPLAIQLFRGRGRRAPYVVYPQRTETTADPRPAEYSAMMAD